MKPKRTAVAVRLAVAIFALVGALPANSQIEVFVCVDSNRNSVLLGTPCPGGRQPGNATNPDTRIAPRGTGFFTNDATGQSTYLDAGSRGPATVYQPQQAGPYVPRAAGVAGSTRKPGQAGGDENLAAEQKPKSANCTQSGNTTTCDDGAAYTRRGDTTYASDGTTYTRSGNTIYRSDGTTYTFSGDTVTVSDGTTYTRSGNTIYRSDGAAFTRSGNTTYASDGTIYTGTSPVPVWILRSGE
jgi:ribosomal protein L27